MFFGWWIVALAFLAYFVSTGCVFYSFGVILIPLTEDLGLTRLEGSLLMTGLQVASAGASPFVGHALDRGSIRTYLVVAACAIAVGFGLASMVGAAWQLYLIFATLLALGTITLGGLGTTTLVANWFVEQRGRALGIAQFAISFSGFVMAPLATWLVATYGWRATYQLYGIGIALVLIPVLALCVRDRPEQMGLAPDGQAPEPDAAAREAAPSFSARALLGERNFWAIALAFAFTFFGTGAVLTHVFAYASDEGLTRAQAATVLAAVTGMGALGKLLFGWLSDQIDRRGVLSLAAGLQALGLIGLIAAGTPAALIAGGAVFGLGMGGLVPIQGALVGACFGREVFGRVAGAMGPVILPLQIAGLPLAGWAADRTGSYAPAFMVFVAGYLVTIGVIWLARVPEVEPGTELAGVRTLTPPREPRPAAVPRAADAPTDTDLARSPARAGRPVRESTGRSRSGRP